LSNLSVTYTWSVPDTFDLNFEWKIVAQSTPPSIPTILTSGPQNAINRPTLIYPNGGEDILTREIEVLWKEPSPPSTDNLEVWYEIYFTENYDYMTEPDWKMIASVPSGIGKFLWKVGNSIKSQNVRVGIRGVNSRGERSTMSISAASFSIRKSQPVTPTVLSPIPGARYGSAVRFIFDDSGIMNSFVQRAKYYIYFSSLKAQIPYTPVVQRMPVGSGPIVWNTSLLPPSDDYVLTIYLADDDGNKSQEINIRDVSIIQEGFFLIDTKPPSGYVQINDSEQFTRDENVSVKMYAYDEATGVHSMQFIEEAENDIVGPPESFANVKYWTLTENDGVKILKVKFQDFGANRTSSETRNFRVLFEIDNDDIADIVSQNSDIVWLAKNGPQPSIYKFDPNSSFVTYVNEQINCLTTYGDILYVSVQTSDSTALIYRWTGFVLEEAFSLSEIDSEVLAMHQFGDKLFFGCKNGSLYYYDGTDVTYMKNFGSQLYRLYSDNSLLYIIPRNSKKIYIYDGQLFLEVIV